MLSARSLLRSPRALPFALLATLAACSSSSTTIETNDAGHPDTGIVTKPDTGVVTKPDTGVVTKTDGGSKADTGTTTLPDATSGDAAISVPPTIPTAAKALVSGQFVQVLGLTSDDYLVYYDKTGGISATDINGTITQIAPGPTTDGGTSPYPVAMGGNLVAVLTDYSTFSIDGTAYPNVGTLSVWSHSLGHLQQVATNAVGFSVGLDTLNSAYIVYADGANSTGTIGNIGISATTAGATGQDVLKNVVVSVVSSSCAPYSVVDNGVVVTTTCAAGDGGVNGKPQVDAFAYNSTSNAWVDTTLLSGAVVNNVYGLNSAAVSQNFVTDTAGTGALTVSATGPTLQYQSLTSATAATILDPFTAPASGSAKGAETFYLSKSGAFALFTQPNAHLGYATLSSSAAPVIKTLNASDTVLGVQTISPDEAYDVDYSTALDMSTGAPSSLYLRSLADGSSHALTTGTSLATTLGTGSWVTGGTGGASTFVLITTDLKATGATGASTGTLYSAAIPAGTINQIVTNTTVWDATALTGKNVIYSQNYIEAMYDTPNGAATADYYTVAADGTGPGAQLATGADAGNYFYITKDKSHIFLTWSFVNVAADGTTSAFAADGLYSMALPTN